MAAYVLVPGAWIGGWAWKKVARKLRAAGHDAYPVTLTGLGERVHLARREVNLETHLTDVLNLLEYEDLREDVVLVGHSYAAIVVNGVADRAGDRLKHLVYLDSAPMGDGKRHLDFSSPDEQEAIRKQVNERGEGWRLPYPGFEQLGPPPMREGLGASERALLDTRSTPQPFGSYEQPLRLQGGRGRFQRWLIACNGFRFVEQLQPKVATFLTPEWKRMDLATGHWPMLSAPDALAELLRGLH
jgi:pimeloyl-ACP methyl ester carboxylesterase